MHFGYYLHSGITVKSLHKMVINAKCVCAYVKDALILWLFNKEIFKFESEKNFRIFQHFFTFLVKNES